MNVIVSPCPNQRPPRTSAVMEHPQRPPAPTVIDVAVERDRIAALDAIRRRLENELDRTPAGHDYAAMAQQLRDTVNALADARNRVYESLLGDEPEPYSSESPTREPSSREPSTDELPPDASPRDSP